jgi:hypothetical protein
MDTCSGIHEGARCTCLRFKPRSNQQENEPVTCLNCTHFDTCHPVVEQAAEPILGARKSSIPALVGKYSALLRAAVPKATENDAREETNKGFLRADVEDDVKAHKPSNKNSKGQYQVNAIMPPCIISFGV